MKEFETFIILRAMSLEEKYQPCNVMYSYDTVGFLAGNDLARLCEQSTKYALLWLPVTDLSTVFSCCTNGH